MTLFPALPVRTSSSWEPIMFSMFTMVIPSGLPVPDRDLVRPSSTRAKDTVSIVMGSLTASVLSSGVVLGSFVGGVSTQPLIMVSAASAWIMSLPAPP